MSEKSINQNVMPEFDLLPHPIRRIGRAICSLFEPFHSGTESYHSNHHRDPLASPEQGVIDWPDNDTQTV